MAVISGTSAIVSGSYQSCRAETDQDEDPGKEEPRCARRRAILWRPIPAGGVVTLDGNDETQSNKGGC